ncbi:redoxin domain-containing protein [Sphingobacterium corticis]|uniref:Redoxin domain-containing protein n=1 Tax=Sphingobacterium corticis TaxID=1812823 RepID=A0ABW5NLH4_9SPHI
MNNKFSVLGLALALSLTACNNSESNKSESASEQTHEGHDHALHNTSSNAQTQTPPAQPAEQDPAATIPTFKFFKVKSGFGFENADIPSGKNTVFILFDPSCGHCQQETQALAKNYEKLKDINLLYISMNDPSLMSNFLSSFGKELDGKPNVEMLYDRNQDFIRNFHIPSMFPANYVYGPDGKLKSYWVGEKPIADILAAFAQ